MEAAKFELPLATTRPQLCDGDYTLMSKAAIAMFLFFLSVRLKLWEKKKADSKLLQFCPRSQ